MATTLQNLRDGVRIETRDPDGIYYQDDIVDYNINQAYRSTYQEIANTQQGYFQTPVTKNIVANQREYALPDDFLKMERVELVVGNSLVPLKKYRRGYLSNYTGGTSLGLARIIPTYNYEGNNLVLEPTPNTSITGGMRWTYVLIPDDLVNSSDEIHASFKDLWKDLLILRASRACLSQIEAVGSMVSPELLQKRLEDLEKQFKDSLNFRGASPVFIRRKGYFQ